MSEASVSRKLKAEIAQAKKDYADLQAEFEHMVHLALVDPGANPTVSYKDLCVLKDSEKDRLQTDLDCMSEHANEMEAENARLREALTDAINSPKGVVPTHAGEFYDDKTGQIKLKSFEGAALSPTGGEDD